MSDEAIDLMRALADDDRLRVVGMLALRPRDPADLALLLGITEASLEHHLRILTRAGLVRRSGGMCTLDSSPLRKLMVATAPRRERAAVALNGASADEQRVLDSFFEGERLVKIPSQRRKLIIVLRALAQEFERDRAYSERMVNEILRRHHEDVASLRRAMVDEGVLERERGRYSLPSEL